MVAEEFLVDDGWKVVEAEPEAAPVKGNGHHAGGIGPTVELVLANGHHANGNGHSDETPEPQQTLFSWAEFMAEEPVKPKAVAASLSPQPRPCSMGAQPGAGAGERAGRRRALGRTQKGRASLMELVSKVVPKPLTSFPQSEISASSVSDRRMSQLFQIVLRLSSHHFAVDRSAETSETSSIRYVQAHLRGLEPVGQSQTCFSIHHRWEVCSSAGCCHLFNLSCIQIDCP